MTLSCVVIGSGNIGTDLVNKLLRSPSLRLRALVGIDPASEGLARARALGVEATAEGVGWVERHAIMTAAAVRVGEAMAEAKVAGVRA